MTTEKTRNLVYSALEDLTAAQLRERLLMALRAWREANPKARVVQMHSGLGRSFCESFEGTELAEKALKAEAAFLGEQHAEPMNPVMEFVWWICRSGLARPGTTNPEKEDLNNLVQVGGGSTSCEENLAAPTVPGGTCQSFAHALRASAKLPAQAQTARLIAPSAGHAFQE